jgi:hypothetical protein
MSAVAERLSSEIEKPKFEQNSTLSENKIR